MTIMLKKGKQQLIADLITQFSMIPGAVQNKMTGGRYISQYNPTLEDLAHRLAGNYMEAMCNNIKEVVIHTIQEHLYTQEDMEKDLNLHK